jgi:SAM-dependent methyltransferase
MAQGNKNIRPQTHPASAGPDRPMINFLLNPEVRDVWNQADEASLLEAYDRVWRRKNILMKLYEAWYRMILEELRAGTILEAGSGTGNFKRWLETQGRRCWTVDILPGKYVNVQADALDLPFLKEKLNNIVLIDVLHHLARPFEFLNGASQLLSDQGRILLVEPYVSLWGRFVYRFFHHEEVDFRFEESGSPKKAWAGNAAIPRLVLAPENKDRLLLKIVRLRYCEFLSYPLSGGFSYRSLLPARLLMALHHMESSRLFCNRAISLRVFAVLEKSTAGTS